MINQVHSLMAILLPAALFVGSVILGFSQFVQGTQHRQPVTTLLGAVVLILGMAGVGWLVSETIRLSAI